MTLGVGLVDNSLNGTCLDSSEETTLLLNREEQLPCLLAERLGELLNEVRTTSNVNHAVEVTLVLQQQLLIACDTLGKVGGSLVGSIERNNNHAVHATQSSTHGLGLRTEHVDIAVEHGLVVGCGVCADMHLGSLLALGVLTHDLSPQHTSCTQLGNLHEVNTIDTKVELDALCSEFCRNTSLGELSHVLVTPSQSIAKVLVAVSTSVGKLICIYCHGTELGIVGKSLNHCLGNGEQLLCVLTLHNHLVQGIEADATLQSGLVITLCLEVSNKDLSQLNAATLTSAEVQFHAISQNAVEQSLDVLLANKLAGKNEAQ